MEILFTSKLRQVCPSLCESWTWDCTEKLLHYHKLVTAIEVLLKLLSELIWVCESAL